MTGIKIVDRGTRQSKRRTKLWECFGKIGIYPADIKDANGAYYAIVQAAKVEEILEEENKKIFSDENFDVLPPIEFNAMRSVVVRHIDKVIEEYSDEDIIDSIEHSQSWAKVDGIVRIASGGRLLKIRFKSTEMVTRALKEGIVILNQFIPSRQVEREGEVG